jgi:ketosteroid isomerase-like protein
VGRGAGSGLEIDDVFGWLFDVRDGKMARFHAYTEVDEALQAAERLAESE